MTNSNCLEGIQCPACKSKGPFWISVETNVLMSDDGWTAVSGHIDDWGSWSQICCDSCDEAGIVREFNPKSDIQ